MTFQLFKSGNTQIYAKNSAFINFYFRIFSARKTPRISALFNFFGEKFRVLETTSFKCLYFELTQEHFIFLSVAKIKKLAGRSKRIRRNQNSGERCEHTHGWYFDIAIIQKP